MARFFQNKGVAMIMVLGTILVVAILANVILTIAVNQSRLTHHQISRIRAYYAGMAAMNLAFEQLRMGNWGRGTYTLCSSGCTINDPDIPYTVNIVISDPNGNGLRTLTLTTDYTYTP